MSDQPNLFDDALTDSPAVTLPDDWAELLKGETSQPYFRQLMEFVAHERETATVYPPPEDMFTALRLTPYADVKVLVLGQDPYHGAGQAHGLSFSVRPGVRPPPSLANIYKELRDDVGFQIPKHGSLTPWAAQGVLLLNAVLTVRAAEPNSHAGKGWEKFTDAIIRALNAKPERVVFILWGAYARKKAKLITGAQHTILESAHPSPLSVTKFMGSKPFSQTNAALKEAGLTPIEWQLPMQAESTAPENS
ncbi:uracil-DNA glycosylase [Deinococcus aquatilis]|jgi:uracil-DNA glycosylase|uniref:uracil-DNA glycosylase n=1 Tax=Deinococcus aquatilis TaxID=519440 RepID=UPI00037C9E4B|nr:uracil-DNA glycosylase [Deinococcus aquatilis]